ncbi:transglutaminase domain-containing protein, partial [Cellulomonas shaoxiangyii]
RRRRGVATTAGRVVAGLVLVGLAAGAAAWAAPGTPGWAQRHVLREDVEPVLAVQRQPSPLTSYRASFRTDAYDTELFRVDVDGTGVDRLRTAVLDAYDGASFRVGTDGASGRFLRLPRSSTAGATAQVEVVVGDAWSGIWVPVPSGVVAAPRFAGLRADALAAAFYLGPDDGSAVTVADGGPAGRGLAPGDSYRVAAAPTARADADVLAAPGQVDTEALAEQHPQLAAWVDAQQVARDADGLVTLVDRLRARSYLSHAVADDAAADAWISALQAQAPYVFQTSYAGHSRARVEEVFTELIEQEEALGAGADDAALVAAVADAEQLAAAAALVARYLGYESRVVMGVRLDDVPGATVPACTEVCTGAHLAAWVEVRSAGGDWVTFDVDPQVAHSPVRVEQGTQAPQNPTTVEPPELPVVDPPVLSRDGSGTDESDGDDEARFGDSPWLAVLRTVGLVAGGLALLVAPLLVLPVAKAVRRRRRRRAAVPEVAVVGAWAELVDRSTDLGRPLAGPTRAAAAAASGRPGAVELARIVDRAVFAAVPPGPDDAAAAWAATDAEVAALAQEHPPWRRVGAALSGASLGRALAPGRHRTGAQAPDAEEE